MCIYIYVYMYIYIAAPRANKYTPEITKVKSCLKNATESPLEHSSKHPLDK